MSKLIECKSDRPELTLSGFKQFHQTFHDIVAEKSHSNRQAYMCRYLRDLLQVRSVGLFLLDPKNGYFRFNRGTPEIDDKYSGGYLEAADELFEPVEDAMPLRFVAGAGVFLETEKTRFEFKDRFLCLLPIRVHSAVKGILMAEDDGLPKMDEAWRVELIGPFLTKASLLVEFFLEYRNLEEKNRSLQLLYEISESLNTIHDEENLLENILTLIEKHMEVDRCSLMIVQPDGRTMRIKNAFGMDDLEIEKVRATVGEGIAGTVAANARALLIRNIEEEPHLRSSVENKRVFSTKSLLSVPLVAKGKVIGVINVNNRKDGLPFCEADLELLTTIGSEMAAVLQRSYMELQLRKARELDKDIRRFSV